MSRLFQRGELKAAVLEIVEAQGPAHGYAVLGALSDRVGGAWRPSPGAVYPALMALEDAGLIVGEERDEARAYTITAAGRDALGQRPKVLAAVAQRAAGRTPSATLGSLVDRFAAELAGRSTSLDGESSAAALVILGRADAELHDLIERTEQHTEEHERHG